MSHPTSPKTRFEPLELTIAARGVARLTLAELAALRKQPDTRFPAGLGASLLKHSDEQTLAALVAVYNAIDDFALGHDDFSQWAIVASSRYLGRGAFAAVIDKYKAEGPWGVSVQVIPHRTSHAVAGTISLALQNQGPAIGIGGGQDLDSRALLATATALAGGNCRGAWMLLTGWSPELTIDEKGQPTSNSTCQAVALALAGDRTALGQIRIDRQSNEMLENGNWLEARREGVASRFDRDVPPPVLRPRTAEPSATNLLTYLADDQLVLAAPWRQDAGAAVQIEVAFERLRWPPARQRTLRLDGGHPGPAASAAPHVSAQPATPSEPR